jgi:hypothetical protein
MVDSSREDWLNDVMEHVSQLLGSISTTEP